MATITIDTTTCNAVKERIAKEAASKRRENMKSLRANLPKNLNWKHIAKILNK